MQSNWHLIFWKKDELKVKPKFHTYNITINDFSHSSFESIISHIRKHVFLPLDQIKDRYLSN